MGGYIVNTDKVPGEFQPLSFIKMIIHWIMLWRSFIENTENRSKINMVRVWKSQGWKYFFMNCPCMKREFFAKDMNWSRHVSILVNSVPWCKMEFIVVVNIYVRFGL
jgi:hypothetical protein